MKKLDNVKDFWKSNLIDNKSISLGAAEKYCFETLLQYALKSDKILEVGIGEGRMSDILRQNDVTAEIHGLDLNEPGDSKDIIFKVGDARELSYEDNYFDVVYSLGVVEHFPETFQAIREHSRVVKKGGLVLVTTPHLCISTPLRYLSYFVKKHYKRGSFEEILGRNLRLPTVRKYFEDSNIKVIQSGVSGIYSERFYMQKLAFLEQLPFMGAYLYCLGIKQ